MSTSIWQLWVCWMLALNLLWKGCNAVSYRKHLHNINISTLWRRNSGLHKTALSQGRIPVPPLPFHHSHVLCSSIIHCLATICTSYQSHQEYVEYSEENHTRKQVHTPSKETAMLSGHYCKILGMTLLHLVSESAEINMICGWSSGIVYITLKMPGLENSPF